MIDPVSARQPNVAQTPRDDSASWLEAFTPGRLVAVIALFLFTLYPGVILGTQSFFFRDFGLFTYPVALFEHESFWHGELPLWNPLNNCGVPFLAQWNTSVCYPLSLLYILFPLPQSLNYFCLFHLVLAGVGMYWLAFRWTQNRLAASVAGLAFGLNGLMLNSLMWTSNLAALSWQPWVILATERAWKDGRPRLVVMAAFAGAMQMLAGAPEIVVFTWVMTGILWLSQAWRRQIQLARAFRALAAIVLLVAALSAIQLLPFFDLLEHSERNSSYALANTSPMPLWGWANFVVPSFRCLETAFGTWLQAYQPWTASYYLGIGTLALAAVAIWRLRRRLEVFGLTAVTLAGLVLALGDGGYVYAWLRHLISWIGFARYPIKFVSIPVFTLPFVAAFGLTCFQNQTPENLKRSERALFVSSTLLLLVILMTLMAARWMPLRGYDYWQSSWPDGIWRALFLIALAGFLWVFNHISESRLRILVAWAILAFIGLDLVTAGMRVNPTVVTKAFGPLELNMSSKPRLGDSRAMLSQQVASYLLLAWTKNPLYYYAGLRGALMENCNITENIPKVDGFCSLHLKDEWDIDGIFYGGYVDKPTTNAPPAPLLDFLGVSQMSAPNTIFAWQARKSFMPLATAGQRPIFADAAETMRQLQSTNFDPRHIVYLPLSERADVVATNGSDAKVLHQQFGAEQAQLTVEAPVAAFVVVAQSFYHDWHAYVDGKPARLLRANHAFQAVQVPAGRHEITFRYEDKMFQLGALISGLTLLGCLAGLFERPVPGAPEAADAKQ